MAGVLPDIGEWVAGGGRMRVTTRSRGFELFVRQDGPADGLPVTLIHGFPTSSHDWSVVVPHLAAHGCRVLTLDLLGFGASDKPRDHVYSVVEQAELVEGVWQALGIGDTALVAHDYGVSVGQELLARDPGRVRRMAWLNGGLYPDLHRPIAPQRLLHSRAGAVLVHAMTERRFTSSMRQVLARPVAEEDLHAMWESVSHENGHLLAHRLLRYIDERKQHAARWVGALEEYPGPTLFVWGPADPISGAHVLERIRARLTAAHIVELAVPAPVGHYPQVEAPDAVAEALTAFLTEGADRA
ncbi:alpha/beta fold hydrolase [Streptomyces olivochromogenes]|uniref:alpha/beta fold hydrolase n=1 Tax=Streptomyces olivochromogenes TaxID=1963 RepID=UPI001F3391B6|nr:alpha/beta fold hydrolase [Streptomyces olivochromogenes]